MKNDINQLRGKLVEYCVVNLKTNEVVGYTDTRLKARDHHQNLGGAKAGYEIQQVQTIVFSKKVR